MRNTFSKDNPDNPLRDYTFRFHQGENPDLDATGRNVHHVVLQHKEKDVGYLGWDANGVIGHISLDKKFRKTGFSDAMLQTAMNISRASNGEIPAPIHSNFMNDAGFKFAKRNWWAGQAHQYYEGWKGEPTYTRRDIQRHNERD